MRRLLSVALALAACEGMDDQPVPQHQAAPAVAPPEGSIPIGGVEAPLDEDAADSLANPAGTDRRALVRGREVYVIHCRPCHGDHGKGDGQVARFLSEQPIDLTAAELRTEWTDGGLFHVVTNGTMSEIMPGFQADLAPPDRWLLVRYLRTLAP